MKDTMKFIEVNSDANYQAYNITHCRPSSPTLPYYTTKQIFLYKVHLSVKKKASHQSTILLLVHPPLYMPTRTRKVRNQKPEKDVSSPLELHTESKRRKRKEDAPKEMRIVDKKSGKI